MSLAYLKLAGGGVEIAVFAQPRASRSRLVGEHDGRLKVQLAAPPVDGAANDALVALFVEVLELPRRQVGISAGQTGRRKVVRVEGVGLEQVESSILQALP